MKRKTGASNEKAQVQPNGKSLHENSLSSSGRTFEVSKGEESLIEADRKVLNLTTSSHFCLI